MGKTNDINDVMTLLCDGLTHKRHNVIFNISMVANNYSYYYILYRNKPIW